MAGSTVDISEVLDGQRWRGFLAHFLVLLCLMAIIDGYDFACMGFAAPSILRDWHVGKATLGVVFAAATVGAIIGGFAFGLISDYWGRKNTAVTALLTFGTMSLVTVRATEVHQLMALRLLAGIGLGGLMPMLLTMAVEFAPQRLRSSLAMLAFIGVATGIASVGFVGAALVPDFGWHIIFWIAGIGPVAIAILVYFALPESPRFLLSRKRPAERIAAVLRRINRRYVLPADAEFTDRNRSKTEAEGARMPASLLFRGRLARITLLLWTAYLIGTITPSLFVTWGPTLAEGLGLAPRFAAISLTIGGFGLIAASFVMMPLLRRYSFIVIPFWTLITVPPLAVIGLTHVSSFEFVVLSVLIGVGGGGSQGGTNAMVGLFYPDECRGTGISWAQMMARIGSVLGPLIAGALLSRGVTVPQLYLLMPVPVILFVICAFLLSVEHWRQSRAGGPNVIPTMKQDLPDGVRASS